MIITIHDEEEYLTLIDLYNPQRRTLPYLIRVLIANNPHHEELEIQIGKSLLKHHKSYLVNPTQLAKNTNIDQLFSVARGLQKGDMIILHFSNAQDPTMGFFQECCNVANKGGTADFAYESVPQTYKANPTLLRWRIKKATEKKVRILKLPNAYRVVRAKTKAEKGLDNPED